MNPFVLILSLVCSLASASPIHPRQSTSNATFTPSSAVFLTPGRAVRITSDTSCPASPSNTTSSSNCTLTPTTSTLRTFANFSVPIDCPNILALVNAGTPGPDFILETPEILSNRTFEGIANRTQYVVFEPVMQCVDGVFAGGCAGRGTGARVCAGSVGEDGQTVGTFENVLVQN